MKNQIMRRLSSRSSFNFLFLLSLLLFSSCIEKKETNFLEIALASEHPNIKRVMDSVSAYEVQIRYTKIERLNDSVVLKDYDFQVDKNTYFYPASTVKLPAAVASLEKLNEIDSLNRNTKFYIEGDSVETTFTEAIQQIFAVSSNEANNRLVEFLGFNELNKRIQNKGITDFRVSHRLSTTNADEVSTKPLIIYLNDSTTSTTNTIVNSSAKPLKLDKVVKGDGYLAEDVLIKEPFDFSLKNWYSIPAQTNLLKRLFFPQLFEENQLFKLNNEQLSFLKEAMAITPHQVGYDRTTYYDGYGKFLMFGDTQENIPEYISIYNKVGYAYGTLTDCAYVVDTKNQVEFILAATILVNKNQIFNDNTYEFEEIGIPFLAQLGREIYELEKEN